MALMNSQEHLLEAIRRGVPVRKLASARADPVELGSLYLGECLCRFVPEDVSTPDPLTLLECLRFAHLWGYYGANAPTGSEVESWIFGLGEVEGFPSIPPGMPRAQWLFGAFLEETLLERAYFYSLGLRPEVPLEHRRVFLRASAGDMAELKHLRSRLYRRYWAGISRGKADG